MRWATGQIGMMGRTGKTDQELEQGDLSMVFESLHWRLSHLALRQANRSRGIAGGRPALTQRLSPTRPPPQAAGTWAAGAGNETPPPDGRGTPPMAFWPVYAGPHWMVTISAILGVGISTSSLSNHPYCTLGRPRAKIPAQLPRSALQPNRTSGPGQKLVHGNTLNQLRPEQGIPRRKFLPSPTLHKPSAYIPLCGPF